MNYDTIIVGAGPGGATAATLMARRGLRVLVVDRASFPRDKICGDAISGKSLDVLRELELAEQMAGIDALDTWGVSFSSPAGDLVSIPFTEETDKPVAPGYVCRREVFDQLLFETAAAAGAEVRTGTAVEGLIFDGDRVVGIRLKGDGADAVEEVRAPLVIGADGAYSAVARALGMDQLDEHHYIAAVRGYYVGVTGFQPGNQIELHFVDEAIPGYFWIFPLPDGGANIGVGMLSSAIKTGGIRLKPLLQTLVEHPRFRDRFAGARCVGPVKGWGLPLGTQPRRMAGNGWMLLGDAASLIDPFTGEGIGNAMISASRAAAWADRALATGDVSAGFLKGYEEDVLETLRQELRLSKALLRLVQWRWPLDLVIRKASRSAELAGAITCMFDDLGQRRKLVSPLFYLRLLFA